MIAHNTPWQQIETKVNQALQNKRPMSMIGQVPFIANQEAAVERLSSGLLYIVLFCLCTSKFLLCDILVSYL